MGRILSIDLGKKRTGLAVTDPLKIIASPLEFVKTNELIGFIKSYTTKEDVESIVVGLPRQMDNTDSEMTKPALKLADRLKKEFPNLNVFTQDERFSTKIALHSMLESGTSKKNRRIKGNVDKISATIILQSFLERKNQ
jgi:putative holliday junction resolvase